LLVAGWALFAFAGVYHWTVTPIIAAAVLLGAAVRPSVFHSPHRLLDFALLICLIVTAAQLIGLPPATRRALSPSAEAVERALFFSANPGAGSRPLSLDPASTAWALGFGTALLLTFWSARAIFARGGGLRLVLRGIAWFGLALAAIMFVQRATTPGLIYGFWGPITRASHPTPLGPFVNRNDIATWLLLASPLVFGYAIARLEARTSGPRGTSAVASLADTRTLWLAASICLMMAALLASLSRSGLFGGAAALLVFAVLARQRLSGKGLGWFLVVAAALVAIAATYASLSDLLQRISDTLSSNLGGRLTVWRETWPMARDFLLTGIGVGAFERGMLVYQQSTRLIFFNHAHNEYLQLLVEGGLLLAIPAALALMAGWWAAHRRLVEDMTPVFWIRAGAASGLAAVAAQSIWDTGLRMPASAVLFAVVAAVALHEPEPIAMSESHHRRRRT
jgi:O-antigen ligase